MKSDVNSGKISGLILAKNNQFIALNKPPGIPVQEDRTQDMSLLSLAEIYCRKRLFVTNRIDRPASGVVLFAKSSKSAAAINRQLKNGTIEKTYLAVTSKQDIPRSGTITQYLRRHPTLNKAIAYAQPEPKSKKAILKYKLIDEIEHYFLLEIELITGRHHQIRVQLAALGCPIKGDTKYGFKRGNTDRSIYLHARKMCFLHPITKEPIIVEAPLPNGKMWTFFKGHLGI